MLENNPMGSRRRLRFYHRIGVVPIPGDHFNEFVQVPTTFFTYGPEIYKDPEEDMARTTVVSVTTLLCRLLDIVNKMIALAEAEERDRHDDETTDSQDETENEDETEAVSESEADAETKDTIENDSEAEPQNE